MNLLITGAWTIAVDYIEKIKDHEICFMQYEKDDLPCDPSWIQGIICNGFFLHHDIQDFPNLRYIQLTSAGYDRVDMDYIAEKAITIHNARGVYSVPMAEFALAGVLAHYKSLYSFRSQQIKHEWIKNRNIRELAGSRVLVVGCGSVGTECAKRFKALDCTVCGIDKIFRDSCQQNSLQDICLEECVQIGENNDYRLFYDSRKNLMCLDEEIEKADVIILTMPLTSETRGLINEKRLSRIHGILVNISRGGVIDQKALERWEGSAVLDVFEEEPVSADNPIWDNEGFIITPHNSFVGDRNGERLSELIIENLERYTV